MESKYCPFSVPMPLTCFGQGCRVQLEYMALEPEAAGRLRAMGVREGACVCILQNADKLIFHVGGSRLGVQRELAMQLYGTEAAG
jgi:Fe2+ transport system protein FeoA